MKLFWLFLCLMMTAGLFPAAAGAAAKLTLTPSSSSQTVGATFRVTIGVDSGTDKIIGIDLVGNFDATKLEVVSIDKADVLGFVYDTAAFVAKKDNTAGTFEMTLTPASDSALTGVTAKGDLVVVTFKGKATGSGAVNFNCAANSVRETNVINDAALDVVDCGLNQSGLYTITAASGGTDSTPTNTPTPTPTSTGTGTGTELPKTGAVETTILVVLAGVISLLGAVLLR